MLVAARHDRERTERLLEKFQSADSDTDCHSISTGRTARTGGVSRSRRQRSYALRSRITIVRIKRTIGEIVASVIRKRLHHAVDDIVCFTLREGQQLGFYYWQK